MTAPAPGTSARMLIVGGVSAGVGLLVKLILPLTYTSAEELLGYSTDEVPWHMKKFGAAVVSFFGTPGYPYVGGLGLADFAIILGAVAIALAIAIRGFEPRVPRPVAPQGYPQGPYPGQYAQPQPGPYAQPQPGQYAQPQASPYQTGQLGQPGQDQAGQAQAGQEQAGQPVPPDQGQPQQP